MPKRYARNVVNAHIKIALLLSPPTLNQILYQLLRTVIPSISHSIRDSDQGSAVKLSGSVPAFRASSLQPLHTS